MAININGILMNKKNLYIYTIGCQMNVYDSDQIESILKPLGYLRTRTFETADLIIVNTCSIRAKAEQKAFSFLGRLADLKRSNPNIVIAMGGCVAQQEKEKVLKRMPHVDLVFGTHAIHRLPKMLIRIQKDRCKIVDVKQTEDILADEFVTSAVSLGQISTFVTIMRGCDNYCTYCVVPYVRGRESSRSPHDIVTEVENLVAQGIKEVTLLGQNVNSYGRKELMLTFPQLLALINNIDGLERIRFTTSHPKDLGPDLMASFKSLDKLCKHIHLPVQSGSDEILKRMNRKYTRQLYLDTVNQLRSICPDIAITSDIIVGFPGESEADFQQTLNLIQEIRYHSIFAFKYSDRPSTPATRFSDKVSEKTKDERLQAVLNIQKKITKEKHTSLIGTIQQVLVEGPSKRSDEGEEIQLNCQAAGNIFPSQWTGRTSTNLIVNFYVSQKTVPININLSGLMVDVIIEKAMAHSISGRIINNDPLKDGLKGDNWYAA
jgi:tRNA-2-methylthio-N6-dimethylallyladenosine synthase